MQRRPRNSFIRAVALLGIIGSCGWAQADPAGTWTVRAPLPTARGEVGVAAVNGKVYVLGGTAQGRWDSPLNHEYDPGADRWRERAPLPLGLSHVGLVGLNQKIYAFGGFTNIVHVGAMDVAYEYDPQTDTWRVLTPLSSPRGSVGAVALEGKIHVVGGRGRDKVTVATHEVYDPATSRWSPAAPLPLARDHFGIAVIDGRIHVVGGRTVDTTDNVDLHDVYDPATDRWFKAEALPTARSSGAAVYLQGFLIYAGGECKKRDPASKFGGGDTFDDTQAYNPKSDKWITMNSLPSGRHAYGGAVVGDVAYLPGGTLRCGGLPTTEEVLSLHLK